MKHYAKKAIALTAALLTISAASANVCAADAPTGDSMLRGNLNGDVKVSVEDAQLALSAATAAIAGHETGLEEAVQPLADVDRDGDLTVKDAQCILRYYCLNTLSKTAADWDKVIIGERPENQVPDTDDILSVISWTDDCVTPLIAHFTEANPQYSGKIRYVNVGSSGGEARELYASYFAGDEDADLFITESEWMLDYINSDKYTRPFTDLGFSEADFDGCYAYTRDLGRDSSGSLKAVAWAVSPGAFVYRSDLAKEYLGVSSPEEMQPLVKDWDTFMDTAAKLKQASNGQTAMIATRGDLAQPMIYSNHGVLLTPDEENPGSDKVTIPDAFKAFHTRMRTAINEKFYAADHQWSDEWYEVGANGKSLGYFFTDWCLYKGSMLEQAETLEQKAAYGKYRITEGPAPWFWGGYFMALSNKTNSGSVAHDFIEHFVVNPETMKSYAEFSGEMVNNSWAMKQVKTPNPLLGGQSPFAALDRTAKKIDLKGVLAPKYFDLSYELRDSAIKESRYEDAVKDFKEQAAKYENIVVYPD